MSDLADEEKTISPLTYVLLVLGAVSFDAILNLGVDFEFSFNLSLLPIGIFLSIPVLIVHTAIFHFLSGKCAKILVFSLVLWVAWPAVIALLTALKGTYSSSLNGVELYNNGVITPTNFVRKLENSFFYVSVFIGVGMLITQSDRSSNDPNPS